LKGGAIGAAIGAGSGIAIAVALGGALTDGDGVSSEAAALGTIGAALGFNIGLIPQGTSHSTKYVSVELAETAIQLSYHLLHLKAAGAFCNRPTAP